MFNYSIKKLTANEIFNYLSVLDKNLIPPLSLRVNIWNYSEKLQNNAVHFCVFDDNTLVGLAACYFNNFSEKTGYVTSFSVTEPYLRKGIARELLNMITDYAKAQGYLYITLRVNRLNDIAVGFYIISGFKVEGNVDDSGYILMKYLIKG
jgi:ribosomal protein S18 acetylase RimI-like enzyme